MDFNWKVEKMKRKIRKMNYRQKLQLMDWLNSWYSYYNNEE